MPQKAPRYSHASMGLVEQGNWTVESMCRTILAVLAFFLAMNLMRMVLT